MEEIKFLLLNKRGRNFYIFSVRKPLDCYTAIPYNVECTVQLHVTSAALQKFVI